MTIWAVRAGNEAHGDATSVLEIQSTGIRALRRATSTSDGNPQTYRDVCRDYRCEVDRVLLRSRRAPVGASSIQAGA